MHYLRYSFSTIIIMLLVWMVFTFNATSSSAFQQQNGAQFCINNQGQTLDREKLFQYQPLGMVTIKIIYTADGNNTVSLALTQPRIGTDEFINNVLTTVQGWSWKHPNWMNDGVAYLTVDLIQQRIHFDLSDLWRKYENHEQPPPIFPDPGKEKSSYLRYAGFNDSNVIITLPPGYRKQMVEATSSIKLLWQRLTPWFFALFLIMLIFAAVTIEQYLANIKFLLFTAIVSIVVFFVLFNFAQPDTFSILVYWGFWLIIFIVNAYYILFTKRVLSQAKLEGDSDYLESIEVKWKGYLKETNDLIQKNKRKDWDKKVGKYLQEIIDGMVTKFGGKQTSRKKQTGSETKLDPNKLSETAKKELAEISLKSARAYSELTEKFNEESLIRFKNEQKLSEKTFQELKDQLPQESPRIDGVDTRNWPSFAKILHAGITNHYNNGVEWYASQEIDRSVDRAIDSELESLQAKGLERLWSLGSIAPMIGLLGTVVGIASSFGKIAKFSGGIEQSELIHRLAGGINVALYTTITGLIIGLTSLLFYYLIKFQLDRLRNEWESRIVDLTNRL